MPATETTAVTTADRTPVIAGNWKMNGSLSSTRELLQGICDGAAEVAAVELAVFPPFVYLGRRRTAIVRISRQMGRSESV
ncbi:MAG: hypothetical protein HC818_06900 [Synechococcaceae cyanobacterium RM1_1_27]|nr:hypothetical protein [Synechococcaceae cyanobacterium RM1_1_27]